MDELIREKISIGEKVAQPAVEDGRDLENRGFDNVPRAGGDLSNQELPVLDTAIVVPEVEESATAVDNDVLQNSPDTQALMDGFEGKTPSEVVMSILSSPHPANKAFELNELADNLPKGSPVSLN